MTRYISGLQNIFPTAGVWYDRPDSHHS